MFLLYTANVQIFFDKNNYFIKIIYKKINVVIFIYKIRILWKKLMQLKIK